MFGEKHKSIWQFLHAAQFGPVKSILIKAVKQFKNLETWPSLTSKIFSKHLPILEVTTFGHLEKSWKNTRSKIREHLALNLENNISSKRGIKKFGICRYQPIRSQKRKIVHRYNWMLPIHH